MGYFDWHEQPGYFRDITRHFPPGGRFLDVGCGTGWLAEHFADYTGLDASADAVAIATGKGRNVQQSNLDLALPFDDCSFDNAVLKDILEHVNDPAATLR